MNSDRMMLPSSSSTRTPDARASAGEDGIANAARSLAGVLARKNRSLLHVNEILR